jgi:hypothetical protein
MYKALSYKTDNKLEGFYFVKITQVLYLMH